MKTKARKSGLDYSSRGLSSTRNNKNKKMKRLAEGTQIIDESGTMPDYGTIIHHVESDKTEDLYLIRWSGGIRTLYEVKKENLLN